MPGDAARRRALAFLSTRTDMPGGRFVGVLALLPMLVPPFILVVGWVALADPNAGFINIARLGARRLARQLVNINTMPGHHLDDRAVPHALRLPAGGRGLHATATPAMEEAARVSGAGPAAAAATRVILPLQRPALLAALLLVVIMSAGDFIIPSTVGLKARIYMLPSLIWQNSQLVPGAARASPPRSRCCWWRSACSASISSGARWRAAAATRIVGGKGAGVDACSRSASCAIRWPRSRLLFALCSSVIPLLAVGAMAFMRYWAPYALKPENLTLQNFHYVLFEYPQVWPSAQHSLLLALLGATALRRCSPSRWPGTCIRMRGRLAGAGRVRDGAAARHSRHRARRGHPEPVDPGARRHLRHALDPAARLRHRAHSGGDAVRRQRPAPHPHRPGGRVARRRPSLGSARSAASTCR